MPSLELRNLQKMGWFENMASYGTPKLDDFLNLHGSFGGIPFQAPTSDHKMPKLPPKDVPRRQCCVHGDRWPVLRCPETVLAMLQKLACRLPVQSHICVVLFSIQPRNLGVNVNHV